MRSKGCDYIFVMVQFVRKPIVYCLTILEIITYTIPVLDVIFPIK